MTPLPRRKVLVVDDEPELVAIIAVHLERAGFEVLRAFDGPSALKLAKESSVCLLVMDLMIPGMTGLEVLKHLRTDSATRDLGVLVLSGLSADSDKIKGLALGADDYLTKPFNPEELVLRVHAILRRNREGRERGDETHIGGMTIDRRQPRVRVTGNDIDLTMIEYRLLLMLADNAGNAQPRERLLQAIWGAEPDVHTRTLDVHIQRLRTKLGAAGDLIETVRGFGYRLNATHNVGVKTP